MDIEALLAEHLEPARRELERQRVLYQQLQTAEIEVRSPDRLVTIVQTCGGEIRDIKIAPGAFERHTEHSFAEVLMKAIRDGRKVGQHAAAQLTEEILQERERSARK